MIKVVHVIIGLNVGGAELMLKRLIESHLTKSSIHHTVISLTSLGVLGPELQKQGVNVYSLNMSTMLKGPIVFFKLRALLKKLQPDVVHSWMYHADLLAGLAAHSLGIRNILWGIRSTDITKGGSKVTILVRKLCALLSYKIPKKILCAAMVSRDVHVDVGYQSCKMEVIPNGFDIRKFSGNKVSGEILRRQLAIPDNVPVFISIGRYSPVKDHKMFVKSACDLLRLGVDARFMMVGRDLTTDNQDLMRLIPDEAMKAKFYMLGERSDIPVCLAAADVFCLHSLTEGFPNVLGEAMLSGLPCIATDVGDAAYLIDDNRFVIPPGSPDKLTSKMYDIAITQINERRALGENNHLRIVVDFSMENIADRYVCIYRDVCEDLN